MPLLRNAAVLSRTVPSRSAASSGGRSRFTSNGESRDQRDPQLVGAAGQVGQVVGEQPLQVGADIDPARAHHLHPRAVRVVGARHDLDIGGAAASHHEVADPQAQAPRRAASRLCQQGENSRRSRRLPTHSPPPRRGWRSRPRSPGSPAAAAAAAGHAGGGGVPAPATTGPASSGHPGEPAAPGRACGAVPRASAAPRPAPNTRPPASGRRRSTPPAGPPGSPPTARPRTDQRMLDRAPVAQPRQEPRHRRHADLAPPARSPALFQERPPLGQRGRIAAHRVRRPQVPVGLQPLLDRGHRLVGPVDHRPGADSPRRPDRQAIRHRCRSISSKNSR